MPQLGFAELKQAESWLKQPMQFDEHCISPVWRQLTRDMLHWLLHCAWNSGGICAQLVWQAWWLTSQLTRKFGVYPLPVWHAEQPKSLAGQRGPP